MIVVEDCWGATSPRRCAGFPLNDEFKYASPLGCCFVTWDIKNKKQTTMFQAHSDLVTVMLKNKNNILLSASYHGEIKIWGWSFELLATFKFPTCYVIFGAWSEDGLKFAVISKGSQSTVVVYSLEDVTSAKQNSENLFQWFCKAPQNEKDNDFSHNMKDRTSNNCYNSCTFYGDDVIAVFQMEQQTEFHKFSNNGDLLLKVSVSPLQEHVSAVHCISKVKNSVFAIGLQHGIFGFYNALTLEIHSVIQATGSPQVCTWMSEHLVTVSYLSGNISVWNIDGVLLKEYDGAPTGSIVHLQQSTSSSDCFWIGGMMSLSYVKLSENKIAESFHLEFHQLTGCGLSISATNLVASGDFTGQVFVWTSKDPQPKYFYKFGNSIRSLAWCENVLLVGLLDGQLYHIEMETSKTPKETYNFLGGVVAIKCNNTNSMVAIGTTAGVLSLLKVDFGAKDDLSLDLVWQQVQHQPKTVDGIELNMEIWSLTWSPDEKLIATTSEEQTCVVIDLAGNVLHTLTGHSAAVTSVGWKVLSTKQNILVTCSDDRTCRIYDGESFKLNKVVDTKDIYGWHTLTYLIIKDDLLIVSTQNGYLVVWDLKTFECLMKKKMHCGSIEGLVLSHDQQFVLTIGSDCVVNKFLFSLMS